MPRDSSPEGVGEVTVAGGRRGRVIETVVAGQFAIEVIGADWLSRLAGAGVLSRDEVEAAQVLQVLFERSGIRPRMAGKYDGVLVDHCAGGGDDLLEALTAEELAAWRRLGRLLSRCPPHCRSAVENLALWDQRPTSIRLVRDGLDAVAKALGRARR